MPSRKHSGPGRRFATWTVEPGNEITGWFSSPQSPEKTLEEFSRGLTSPSAMVEGGRFAMGVWELPEGAYFPDDVDRRDPAYNTYMQFVGTHQAMVIEARREHPDGTFEHYVIARQPVQDPSSWTTFTYVDNPPSRTLQTTTAQMQVHPEEIFTGTQATEVLARYLLHAALPPKHLLRPICT